MTESLYKEIAMGTGGIASDADKDKSWPVILPCPFCGGTSDEPVDCWSEYRPVATSNYPDEVCCYRFVLRCMGCSCEMPGDWVADCEHIESLPELVAAWNKRAAL